MTNRASELSVLFARLSHFSGMVRERTCVEIAQLLNDDEWRGPVQWHLQQWMESQTLESVAIFALLIWIRARIENTDTTLPDVEQMLAKYPRPSLLSLLLLRELYGQSVQAPDWCVLFSGDAPSDFEADDFFQKYARNFLPPVYKDTADNITRRTGEPFTKQWAWEWHRLLDATATEPDARVMDCRGRPDSEHYITVDFRLSEIYRSAYLRALAWAICSEVLPENHALILAARCCPVDLALWQVRARARPAWWPRIPSMTGTVDTTAARAMQELETLWEHQASGDNDWIPVQASGRVGGGTSPLELEIYGLFQRCMGPLIPTAAEVAEWYRATDYQQVDVDSFLRLGGTLQPVPPSGFEQRFEDWLVVPASVRVDTLTVPRWQWWRAYRDIWAPASFLGRDPLILRVTDTDITIEDSRGIIGRWIDWADNFQEKEVANLPPATGQCLLVRRDVISDFSSASRSSFCWIWRFTVYHRQHDYQPFETLSMEGEFGATSVIWG